MTSPGIPNVDLKVDNDSRTLPFPNSSEPASYTHYFNDDDTSNGSSTSLDDRDDKFTCVLDSTAWTYGESLCIVSPIHVQTTLIA